MRIVPDSESLDLGALGARLDQEDGAGALLARIEAVAQKVLDARDPDAAVASLDYDSVLDDDWRTRLRSGRTQRVLAFATPSFAVDVEVEARTEGTEIERFRVGHDTQRLLPSPFKSREARR